MNIAIIGAGLAGLGAARELQRAGHAVTIFEKSRAVGGRLAARRAGIEGHTLVFDHGAQNIKGADSALDAIARELLGPSAIREIAAPVCLHDGSRILPGDPAANAETKWSCEGGITRLAKALAAGGDIRFGVRVASLSESVAGVELRDETASPIGNYDRVILTAPAPQAVELLENSQLKDNSQQRLDALRSASYSRCLSLMLWYPEPLDAAWYALLAQDRNHPLLWLARENAKRDVAVGTALVAQLGPQWSEAHYNDSDESLVGAAGVWIGPLLGKDFTNPQWYSVKRWRYAHPLTVADFNGVNPTGSPIIVCGDALAGGKAHLTYDSGVRAARMLLEN